MDLVSSQIPIGWLIVTWLFAAAMFALIALRAFWPLFSDPADRNVFFGACVTVLVLWQMKAGVAPGLSLHLLGATALTLMFRPLLAMLAMGIVVACSALWTHEYAAFAINWLIMGALPVSVSWLAHRTVSRWLPSNPFVYFLVNAFGNAALSMFSVGVVAALVSLAIGLYPGDYLLSEYLPFYVLMAWGEAFLTGALVTLMVVWKPEWVATFSDDRYLRSPRLRGARSPKGPSDRAP